MKSEIFTKFRGTCDSGYFNYRSFVQKKSVEKNFGWLKSLACKSLCIHDFKK